MSENTDKMLYFILYLLFDLISDVLKMCQCLLLKNAVPWS
jgi:hypothetical protein